MRVRITRVVVAAMLLAATGASGAQAHDSVVKTELKLRALAACQPWAKRIEKDSKAFKASVGLGYRQLESIALSHVSNDATAIVNAEIGVRIHAPIKFRGALQNELWDWEDFAEAAGSAARHIHSTAAVGKAARAMGSASKDYLGTARLSGILLCPAGATI